MLLIIVKYAINALLKYKKIVHKRHTHDW